MELSNWRSQIRKGLIEFCLLQIVEGRKQAYGLELLQGLQQSSLDISEGTLYPLLSRLVKEGYLSPKWETPDVGHPRKYYQLTLTGKRALQEMRKEWDTLTQSITTLSPPNLTSKKKT